MKTVDSLLSSASADVLIKFVEHYSTITKNNPSNQHIDARIHAWGRAILRWLAEINTRPGALLGAQAAAKNMAYWIRESASFRAWRHDSTIDTTKDDSIIKEAEARLQEDWLQKFIDIDSCARRRNCGRVPGGKA